MDVFKKLKSVFVIDDGTATTTNESNNIPPTAEESNSVPASNSTTTTSNVTFDAASVQTGNPDSKFLEILFKAIEDNNLQGFDYLEFKSSLQSLSKMNMDEATKYQSAMAMAKTMGATKDKIVQSGSHYLSILSKENDKFQGAVQSQRQKIKEEESSGLKNVELSIQQKKKQIEALNIEIEKEAKKLEEMKESISSSANKIAETTAKFDYAYKVVSQQINDDLKNITTYVKEA